MRRRNFLKKLGISTPLLIGSTHVEKQSQEQYLASTYPEIKTLQDAINTDGQVMVRLAFYSKNPFNKAALTGKINIKRGKQIRSKAYFFEAEEDQLNPNNNFSTHTSLDHCDVVVLWIEEVSEATEISLKLSNKTTVSFTFQDILDNNTHTLETGESLIKANFLMDKEIGEVDPKDLGIKIPDGDFTIAVMADTQGGDTTEPTNESNARMKIHNAFVEESVRVVNELDTTPLFSIVIGDIVDSKGQWANFQTMLSYLKKLNNPLLFSLGNHETAYKIELEPGYNMKAFANYFKAQKEANELDKLLYSFNLGEWHFIVWPDPLRKNFWETHPHYFDWLERDLEKHKDRPVLFFHHVPLMPIGINPLINYAETVDVKRQVIDILGKHGNVQYALSGHVHIPLKASVKTAVNYKGIRFINLPAAGYRPRAFGEEDFYGDPVQGVAVVKFSGKKAEIQYKNVTNQVYTYPTDLNEYEEEKYPLWLKHKWELPAQEELVNGDFRQGLKHWHKRYIYTEDENPSNICEVRANVRKGSAATLYMSSRKRGFDIPGQDRLPQTINRICTILKVNSNENHQLKLGVKIDGNNTKLDSYNAAFIWIEGYAESYKRLNLVYSSGKMYYNIGGNQADSRTVRPIHYDLPLTTDTWQEVTIHIAQDHDQAVPQRPFNTLDIDRLIINLGTWTINDSKLNSPHSEQIAIFFDQISLLSTSNKNDTETHSSLDGRKIAQKKNEDFWYGGIKHIAGEHIYKQS